MLEKIRKMSWAEWGVVLAVAGLLLALPAIVNRLIEYSPQSNIEPSFFSPWIHADAVTTKIAVEEFSSRQPPGRSFVVHRAMALVETLLFYVIGPGLLILYGVGTSSGEDSSRVEPSGPGSTSVFFQTGLALMLAGLVNLGMSSVLPRLARQQAEKENANQKIMDQMTREALKIGYAGYQYYALPDSLGGGGGSFRGLTFNDIDSTLGFPTTPYRLRVESDTLLKIVGTKPSPYRSGEDEDSIRVVARSTPSSVANIETEIR